MLYLFGLLPPLAWVGITTVIAQETNLPPWFDLALGPLGLVVFLLVIVVYGGTRKPYPWWAYGRELQDRDERLDALETEKNMYRDLLLRSIKTAEQGAEVARALVLKPKDAP